MRQGSDRKYMARKIERSEDGEAEDRAKEDIHQMNVELDQCERPKHSTDVGA